MDVCIELARDFGGWLAERFTLPVYLYARAATRPDRRVLADIRQTRLRGPVDGPGRRPRRPRLRPPTLASHGRSHGRRRATVPHRLEHPARHPGPGSRASDRIAHPGARWRSARGPGTRHPARVAGLRPGVHEPAGPRANTHVARARRGSGSGRRRRCCHPRLRAHRPGTHQRVPGHGRSHRRATRRSQPGSGSSRPLRSGWASAAPRATWRSSCDWTPTSRGNGLGQTETA